MLKLKIINDVEPLKMKVNAKFPNVIHETADLSNYYTKTEIDEKLEEKQDTLTAGDNITIENNVISAEVSGGGSGDLVTLIPIYDVGFCAYNVQSANGGTTWDNVSDLDITKKAIDVINTAYSKGYSYFILTAHHMGYSGNKKTEVNIFKSNIDDLQTKPTSITLFMEHDLTMPFNTIVENYLYYSKEIVYGKYTIQGTWENNVFTPTRRDYVVETTRLLTTDVLTKYTKSFTPSGDYNLVHKKYVDDLPKSYTGYDATKTQVLKNVNGTLTWIDE